MTEGVTYDLVPLDELPKRRYRKSSKYDPILDTFIESKKPLSQLTVTLDDSSEERDANYLRTQLNKRIGVRGLSTVQVSVVNNVCYLQRVKA